MRELLKRSPTGMANISRLIICSSCFARKRETGDEGGRGENERD